MSHRKSPCANCRPERGGDIGGEAARGALFPLPGIARISVRLFRCDAPRNACPKGAIEQARSMH